MSAFLSSFVSYLVEMIILAAIGILGGFIGIKLRQRSNAKAETAACSQEGSDHE